MPCFPDRSASGYRRCKIRMPTSSASSIPAMSSIFFRFFFIRSISPRLPRSQPPSQYVLPKALCQSAVHSFFAKKCTTAACQFPHKTALSLITLYHSAKKACQHIPGAIRVVSRAIHADLLCFCRLKKQKDPQTAPELSGPLRVFLLVQKKGLEPSLTGNWCLKPACLPFHHFCL